mmetsp:Transcript_11301/g.47198  ORF Transcript_11301/g.47198 Transcript_11301/m.47198 type:complete len:224 (-) Transcript_11301:391-1062(-)
MAVEFESWGGPAGALRRDLGRTIPCVVAVGRVITLSPAPLPSAQHLERALVLQRIELGQHMHVRGGHALERPPGAVEVLTDGRAAHAVSLPITCVTGIDSSAFPPLRHALDLGDDANECPDNSVVQGAHPSPVAVEHAKCLLDFGRHEARMTHDTDEHNRVPETPKETTLDAPDLRDGKEATRPIASARAAICRRGLVRGYVHAARSGAFEVNGRALMLVVPT